jgi:hypothetical protein
MRKSIFVKVASLSGNWHAWNVHRRRIPHHDLHRHLIVHTATHHTHAWGIPQPLSDIPFDIQTEADVFVKYLIDLPDFLCFETVGPSQCYLGSRDQQFSPKIADYGSCLDKSEQYADRTP